MRDKTLNLLGLMRRANAIALGEENTGAAMRQGKAKILLIAEDASDNARKRAASFAAGRSAPVVPLPFSKEEIAGRVGVQGCSMAAVTDLGFARALLDLLAAQWPEEYAEQAAELARRLEREKKRRSSPTQERKKSIGKRRTNA